MGLKPTHPHPAKRLDPAACLLFSPRSRPGQPSRPHKQVSQLCWALLELAFLAPLVYWGWRCEGALTPDTGSLFLPSPPKGQKEPSEAPTPKRPRGRPKGSKNKGSAKSRKTTTAPGRKPRGRPKKLEKEEEEGISQESSEEEQ
uniref:High mobility group protein HMG-I/HMG-Y n=1 Tax=Monodelphis domestica TaxID=13616 RepID=A0A5F8GEK7_MONDO